MPPNPTEAELEILHVLWAQGPSTVRDVHAILGTRRNTGYTTVLKLMQIMAQKGLVTRDESKKTHVYEPAIGQEGAQRQLVKDLLDRAFQGSAERLVMRALETQRIPAEELARIRQLLDEVEEKRHD